MLTLAEKIRGGLWGLLVGDAVGVPYEFHPSNKIPSFRQIEMEPPTGYNREYPHIQPGTWSDDGAQALCLLDSLLTHGKFYIEDFAGRLVSWMDDGLWAIEGFVFDSGIQTEDAIKQLRSGISPTRSGFVHPNGKGNGALMRVLPLVLWHHGTDETLIETAHLQSMPTHGHITNQVCCAFYCLWARGLLEGQDTDTAYESAVSTLRDYYGTSSEYRHDLDTTVRPDDDPQTDGSGYVVATLHAARLALRESSYEDVIKRAISFGIDTDTNAAVAGGLAGIRQGFRGIPNRWIDTMRGKELVDPLLDSLVQFRCNRES